MISIEKARTFVHANGTLWERALRDYLFDQAPFERVHQTLLCYKNADGGWDYEHGLSYWQPYFSTIVLLALRNYNRL